MGNGIVVLDRRDLVRLLQVQLHAKVRDDVKIRVQYLVTFEQDEEEFVNVVVDPNQALPRWKAKQLVESVLERLAAMDPDANTPQGVDLPVSAENLEQALVTSGG